MPVLEKYSKTNNPIQFSTIKTQALDEALTSFLAAIDEYGKLHELSEEEKNVLKKVIKEVYLEKKASYLIEHKFNSISHIFIKSFENALTNILKNKKKEDINSVFYYNKKRLISNEQY